MLIDIAKIESIRQQLNSLTVRCDEIRNEATTDLDYPQGDMACASATVFALKLTEVARGLITSACEEIGLSQTTIHSVVAEDHADLVERQLRVQSGLYGAAPEAVAAARLAAAQKMQKLAADLISRAQACLDREETITGEALHHSPLWYK